MRHFRRRRWSHTRCSIHRRLCRFDLRRCRCRCRGGCRCRCGSRRRCRDWRRRSGCRWHAPIGLRCFRLRPRHLSIEPQHCHKAGDHQRGERGVPGRIAAPRAFPQGLPPGHRRRGGDGLMSLRENLAAHSLGRPQIAVRRRLQSLVQASVAQARHAGVSNTSR
ncbi:hypothetical protein EEB15_01545 [Ramlibacter sp. WS9]|nr:hypothetical protein EEB15_01545 [Ramlibacter sp. WS9]